MGVASLKSVCFTYEDFIIERRPYGRFLNSAEIEQRVQAGEEIVCGHFGELVHGPGELFMLYGSFVYALAIYPVIFTVIFLILLNALRKKANI
ncbi:hypothetical protein ABC345_21140 [Shouchella sp. 1P09AA]|uniref:hypothetical protein n=1 Tax=unclassified Shouchella TaxID=2893065 RepID=UPI0039A19005